MGEEDGRGRWERKLGEEVGRGSWERKLGEEDGRGSWERKLGEEVGVKGERRERGSGVMRARVAGTGGRRRVCACVHVHLTTTSATNKQTNKQTSKQTSKQAIDLLSVSKPPLKPVKPFRGTRLPSKPRNLSNSCDPVGLDSIASSVDCEAAQYMTPNL